MRNAGKLFFMSLAVCLIATPLMAHQAFHDDRIESGQVITDARGSASHISGTAKVGKFTGDVSWIMDQSEVGVIHGKVSWITGSSRVGAVTGDVSWVIDNARVGLIKGKVSHVKNQARVGLIRGKVSHVNGNARVGLVIGDVSWVADDAYIDLVVGQAPQTMGRGRVGTVVNRQTCRTQSHWLCSWLGYSPPLSERTAASTGADRPAPTASEVKKAERRAGCSRIITTGGSTPRRVEVPVDCRVVRKNTWPPLRTRPPLKALLTATLGRAAKMLGQPTHSYDRDGSMINFYGRRKMISMRFRDSRPTLIKFDLAADVSRENVAAWLGFESLPPPVEVPVPDSLIWFDSANACIIEVRRPKFKLEGRDVHSVIIHFPGQQTVDRLKMEHEAFSRGIGGGR